MQQRKIINPTDVYQEVKDYWGGELSPELIEFIIQAEDEHLLIAQERWPLIDVVSDGKMLNTDRFGLRPVIAPDFRGDVTRDVRKAALLSLHCDELVLDANLLYPFGDPEEHLNAHGDDWSLPDQEMPSSPNRDLIAKTLLALYHLRPLIEVGAISFGHLRLKQTMEDVFRATYPVVAELARTLPSGKEAGDIYRLGIEAQMAVMSTFGLVTDRQGTPTSSSPIEWQMWQRLSKEFARSKETSTLQTLAQLPLPTLSSKISEILAIRSDSAALGKWRTALANVLEEAGKVEGQPDQVSRAGAIVSGRLVGELKRLEVSLDSSPAIRSMRGAVLPTLLAAIPTIPTVSSPLLVGGILAGSGAIGVIDEYLKGQSARRGNRAMLDLAVHLGSMG
ncbi:hypothetical protein [Pseudarthrobacter sp. GA104]|uniref:hypothetical protein n=1 Tax=Pseudarthrobacter sp. GA104 TaxID=2676311 RepID=UPI0012FBDE60|nr:hypothetical protein [Pseudarthrobacter sp. GA104]MUU70527.1 hypothetical protein [Pseudarthrobacter sp. GA104]